jgi:hypothetical protein
MSDEQARRVGLNEAIFRQVNEQIESLNRDLGTGATMTVVGECAERLEISLSEYERVRADARRYVIVPGHQLPEFESIVESGDVYDVVEKREGTAAALAEETDPRS